MEAGIFLSKTFIFLIFRYFKFGLPICNNLLFIFGNSAVRLELFKDFLKLNYSGHAVVLIMMLDFYRKKFKKLGLAFGLMSISFAAK